MARPISEKHKSLAMPTLRMREGEENGELKSKEEIELEKAILGEGEDVIENLDRITSETNAKRKLERKEKNSNKIRKPVWEDKTDLTETQVLIPKRNFKGSLYYEKKETTHEEWTTELKNRFTAVSGTPSWAELGDTKGKQDTDVEDILQRVGSFIGKPSELPKETVDITFCKNIGTSLDYMGSVKSVEFHPKSQVILIAKSKRHAILRQVDGVENPIIQKVAFDRFLISCARFTTDGERFIISSNRHNHYFSYNMMTGNISQMYPYKSMGRVDLDKFYLSPDGKLMVVTGMDGYIHMLSAKTNEFLYSNKMNSKLCGVTFSPDGTRMYSHSDEGQVYIWDMRQRRCLHKFQDDGCIHGTAITLSTSEQYLATGSDTGVVNIYDTSSLLYSQEPKPSNIFLNLTTAITELKFNSTSEILAMASSEKPAAFRLVHCSSMTVFKNVPYYNWKMGPVSCLDISLNSGFLAAGTNQGVAHLFRLNQYGNY